jgi:glycogen synthase kinase 3 beta
MEKECPIKESDLEFPINNVLGMGAFGKVILAIVKGTGEKVAIKKVFQDRRYKNRELPIMKELHHPNIVELKSYFCTKAENCNEDEFFLNCIMEYVPETLSDLITENINKHKKFDKITLKIFTYQMLKCIGYLHSLGICHRDIKPQNILIDPSDNTLKLCDFGCAKHLVKTESNIAYICSRFYRPPELVIGATKYTTQVDVWSMGCVISELVLEQPIFPGKSASDQLMVIMNILGTPTNEEARVMNYRFRGVSRLPKINAKPWKEVFKEKIDDELFIDLVSKLLVYEPLKRLSPYEALCHPFFDELKNGDVQIPKHLFEFKQCEIDFDKENIEKLLSQIKK